MTERPVKNQIVHRWYMRPVLFVADVLQIDDPDGNELLFPVSE